MRLLTGVIVLAILGLMAFTNPQLEDYNNFIRQSVIKESQKHGRDSLEQLFGSLMGGIAGGLLASQTIRTDYVLFSTYEAQFGKSQLKVMGICKNFIILERPEFLEQLKDRKQR